MGQKWLNNAKITANYLVCNIEGQKHYHYIRAFALTGRINPIGIIPQGVALGYVQILPFQGASGNAGQFINLLISSFLNIGPRSNGQIVKHFLVIPPPYLNEK